MKLTLSSKTILIIDDYPVMRKSMKDMLYGLGAQYIFEAENGLAALAAMKKQKFDFILCDYNLGDGKNGQQVLEEVRYKKLISHHSVFIIVSAHQSAIDVLCTIENKPDEYLAKPFNAQQLLRRLEKSFIRKHHFSAIEKAIDNNNFASAIYLCDKAINANNKSTYSTLLKLRAELAIITGDYEKAGIIYNATLAKRDLNWARLGLGIIAYHQDDFKQATQLFQELIEQNPMLMECYDWLTKSYEALDKTLDAENTLNRAVNISPQSLIRQKKLANLAEKTGHIDLAETTYKAITDLGKFSMHQSPSDFSGLAKIYSKKNKNQEALQTIDSMRQQFINNQESELRAATIETMVYQDIGEKKLSELAFQKVNALKNTLKNKTPKDLQLDIAKAYYLNDDNKTADQIIASLIKNHIEDNSFINDIRQMQNDIGQNNYSEVLIQQTKQQLIDINNQGVTLFQQGQLKEAFLLFEQAIEKMPNNKTILLNMAKITIHDLKLSGITEANLLLANRYINRAKQAGVAKEKLGNLQLEFEKLINTPPPLV